MYFNNMIKKIQYIKTITCPKRLNFFVVNFCPGNKITQHTLITFNLNIKQTFKIIYISKNFCWHFRLHKLSITKYQS